MTIDVALVWLGAAWLLGSGVALWFAPEWIMQDKAPSMANDPSTWFARVAGGWLIACSLVLACLAGYLTFAS